MINHYKIKSKSYSGCKTMCHTKTVKIVVKRKTTPKEINRDFIQTLVVNCSVIK